MKYASVLLIIVFCQLSYSLKCPDGNGPACDVVSRCKTGTICYRDLDNATSPHCCKTMLCPITQMMTYHSGKDHQFSHKMNDDLDTELYYEDSTLSIACPFPYSSKTMQWSHDLPVGFSKNGTDPLKTCQTNGDCGEGHYCGESVNPSFAHPSLPKEERKTTMDESDNGGPRRFCYKNPVIDDKFKIEYNASYNGLHLCNIDSHCPKDSICFMMSESSLQMSSKIKGICVKAFLCDNPTGSTRSIGVLPKNGNYCKNANDCNGMKDDVYTPNCVSFKHNNSETGSLCCFTAAQCQYGTAKTPKVSCKNNADCNKGVSPWTSWCDDKGYCCQDTTRTETAFCPDGVTLALNEPECQGTCKNGGVCINGHCCPGTKVEDGKLILGERPYTTKTKCDPNEPLDVAMKNVYCSPEGFVVSIGLRDAFDDLFTKIVDTVCNINADCQGESPFCVRGYDKTSNCFRDPFKQVPTKNVEYPFTWNIKYVVGSIVVVLVVSVVIGCTILHFRKKRVQCRKKEALISLGVTLSRMFKIEPSTGTLPPATHNNFVSCVETGWKLFAVIYNAPEYKAKSYYEEAVIFLTKLEQKKSLMAQQAHIFSLPFKRVWIARDYSFKDFELRKGNTPREEVSLKRAVWDPTLDQLRGGRSDEDDVQLDSSTEEDDTNDELTVDKTQRDDSTKTAKSRSRRKKAGRNSRDGVAGEASFPTEDEEDVFMVVTRGVNEGEIYPPFAAWDKIRKAKANKEEKEAEEKARKDGNKYKLFWIYTRRFFYYSVHSLGCIVGLAEREIPGNHHYVEEDSEEYERAVAGGERILTNYDKKIERRFSTHKNHVKPTALEEKKKLLLLHLKNAKTAVPTEDINVQLFAVYGDMIEKAKNKSKVMKEAHTAVDNALKDHKKSAKLLKRKIHILSLKLIYDPSVDTAEELRSTLCKLIDIEPTLMHLHARTLMDFTAISMLYGDRNCLQKRCEKVDTTDIRKDISDIAKQQPNWICNLVMLGKLEYYYGNRDTGMTYLERVVRMQASTQEEQIYRNEACEIVGNNPHHQV